MPAKRTYYEILGVPRSATSEIIKRRYRQLARKHHPDVAEDKAAAQAAFIEIKEAYEALTNPSRRAAYDALLNRDVFNTVASAHANRPEAERHAEHRRSTAESVSARREAARRYIADARIAFVRKRYASAVRACREAQRLDPKNAEAHIILGDVYQAQGRIEEAVTSYAMAAHLSPADKSAKERMGSVSEARRKGMDAEEHRRKLLKSGYGLIAGAVIIFLFGLLAISRNSPAPWLDGISFVDKWSTLLVTVLTVDGALIGMLMSINGNINRMDNELIYSTGESGGLSSGASPVILFILSASLFSFYLAAGLYLVIGLAEENFSKSMLKVFGVVFVFVLLVSVVYWPDRAQVVAFGGNIALPAMVFGWVIGDVLRPSW